MARINITHRFYGILHTCQVLSEGDVCGDTTFQNIQLQEPVHCQASCFRHDFEYFDKLEQFCLCSNNASCGFTSVLDQYPTSLTVSANDGWIAQDIQVLQKLLF